METSKLAPPAHIDPEGSFDWPLLGALATAAAIGAAAILPYQLALFPDAPAEAGLSFGLFVAVTILSAVMLATVASVIGLTLGRKVGLGAPLLAGLVRGRVDVRGWRRVMPTAIATGLVVAVAVVAIDLVLVDHLPEVETAEVGLVTRFVASLYGAVNEELLLRFGLLSALVWMGSKLFGSDQTVRRWLLWAATIVAAVGFGAAHLPAVAAVVELTPLVAGRTVVLNAMLGVAFGWLYWSRGLAAAMVAHLVADLVIQTAAWGLA